jgi:hypothetical protein
MKRIETVNDFPDKEHFAVLTFRTRSEGDGYGGFYDVKYTEYHVFDSQKELEDWLVQKSLYSYDRVQYVVLHTHNVKIETKVSINISKENDGQTNLVKR